MGVPPNHSKLGHLSIDTHGDLGIPKLEKRTAHVQLENESLPLFDPHFKKLTYCFGRSWIPAINLWQGFSCHHGRRLRIWHLGVSKIWGAHETTESGKPSNC